MKAGDILAGIYCKNGTLTERGAQISNCPAGHFCPTPDKDPIKCRAKFYCPTKVIRICENTLYCKLSYYTSASHNHILIFGFIVGSRGSLPLCCMWRGSNFIHCQCRCTISYDNMYPSGRSCSIYCHVYLS